MTSQPITLEFICSLLQDALTDAEVRCEAGYIFVSYNGQKIRLSLDRVK